MTDEEVGGFQSEGEGSPEQRCGVPTSRDSSATVPGGKAAKAGTGPVRLGDLGVGMGRVSHEIR